MVSTRQGAHAFSAEGEVVELLQEAGALRAKILLRPGTVLDVTITAPDVHLGDQVGIEGSITVERFRTRDDADAPPGGSWRRVNASCPPPE